MRTVVSMLLASVLCLPAPALAQTVIMRKPLRALTGVDDEIRTASWKSGSWSAPSTTCGTSTETRVVSCVGGGGAPASEGACSGPRPESMRTVSREEGCTFSWLQGTPSVPPGCGTVTATRTVICQRSDGRGMEDAACSSAGEKPVASVSATDYSTCTFGWAASEWSAYGSTCSDSTARTRVVSCQRSDGTASGEAKCVETKPAASETSSVYSGCSYAWNSMPGACTGQNRAFTVTCQRSGSGYAARVVEDSFCTEVKPSLSRVDQTCGPPNLFLNSGFENGSTSWSGNSKTSSKISFDQAHSGGASMRLDNQNGAVSQAVGGLTPGKTYTFSAWYLGGGGVGIYFGPDGGYPVQEMSTSLPYDSQWHQVSMTVTAKSGGGNFVLSVAVFNGVFVDDASLTEN